VDTPTTPQEAYAIARSIGERHAAAIPDDATCRTNDRGEHRPCGVTDFDFANFDDLAGEIAAWKRLGKVVV